MVVLGIDPGVAHTGFGVVESRGGRLLALVGGVIETAPGRELSGRLVELLEDNDDVDAVHANFDVPAEVMEDVAS